MPSHQRPRQRFTRSEPSPGALDQDGDSRHSHVSSDTPAKALSQNASITSLSPYVCALPVVPFAYPSRCRTRYKTCALSWPSPNTFFSSDPNPQRDYDFDDYEGAYIRHKGN